MTTNAPTESERTATRDGDDDRRADLPAHECARCGRAFAREDWLALHRGLTHPRDLTEAEAESFRRAYGAEEDELRRFRLKAIGLLIVLYFGLLMVYAVV